MRAILQAFALESGAERIVGWIEERNRAALAMCRRIGFEVDGRLPLAEPALMIGWRP
jgi:RimJ/RimL family protein N-acetyltransferase